MILYHITKGRLVNRILREGLTPKYDQHIKSRELGRGRVINLTNESGVSYIVQRFKTAMTPRGPQYRGRIVVLKVIINPEDAQLVHHKDHEGLSWFITTKSIPPENILEVLPT